MVFWLICGLMTLAALALVLTPMLRQAPQDTASPDVAIYKAQLAEIDRDVARDVLAKDEAERARVEISRRLLSADRQNARSAAAAPRQTRTVAAASAIGISLIAAVCYVFLGAPEAADQPLSQRLAMADQIRENRPSQAALEAAAPPPAQINASDDHLEMVAQLRAIMTQRTEDLTGWSLLAEHEAKLGNFRAASDAQTRVLDLLGEAATPRDLALKLDLMVQAAGGYVSPEAETLSGKILDRDETNTPALYHLGALYAQTGRADLAFRFWRPIVDSGTASFHADLARARIDDIAQMAGIRYSAPDLPGPDAAAIAAAEDLSDGDRQAMIAGMVARLSDRLANEGGGPNEWARLISAYGVLGDLENAALIWAEARDVFGSDSTAMETLTQAARSAGLLQ